MRTRPPCEPALGTLPDRDGGPARRAMPARQGRAGRWLVLALIASAALHAGAIAALLFWPVREPVEEPGQLGSVALVFADTASAAGAPAEEEAAEPPAPPAPPSPPAPQAPQSPPQAAAPPPSPPPPAPPPPAAAPAAPAMPDMPRDIAALPPDPAGILPPPPPAETIPPPQAAPQPPEDRATPDAPSPAEATPPPPPDATPREAQAAPEAPPPADPLPLPPPEPPRQVAAAPPPQPARPPQRPAQPQAPVRLDAGSGDPTEGSLGSFALGAVVPPGADAGIRNDPPAYPDEARRRGQEGVVRLVLRIAADGRVTEAAVDESSGVAALDRAALEAARRWRFRPAMRAGMPVAANLTTAVHFRLSDARR